MALPPSMTPSKRTLLPIVNKVLRSLSYIYIFKLIYIFSCWCIKFMQPTHVEWRGQNGTQGLMCTQITGREKHTALLYAIEASSVASRRYFLQTRLSLINAHIWIEAEYITEKCHLLTPYFMECRYRILSVSFKEENMLQNPKIIIRWKGLLNIISTWFSSYI